MSLINLIKERKSVRNYKRKKIPDEKIYDILRIGRLAPSGANRQPWLYIIVKDQKIKKLIRTECEKVDEIWHRNAPQSIRAWLKKQNITSEKRFLTDAPVLLCVFGDKRAPYWLESTWISISYITLAIVEQNLGTITYTPGDPSFLNEILEVPDNFVPLAILPVGIPEETKIRKTTKKIRYNNRIFINRYVKEKNHKKEKKRNEISYKIPALDENNQKIKRCACGCGQPIVSLVRSRIFIPGHSKFGKNGILKILKNPPKCKCGCGNPVSWNWEEMKWNK
ncbi:hypothetical protein DRQ09_05025 [candidate division KSB1 bacterium]|nr:MAG: hypothetical protein DRQ09_05025 [candidate division KSB1 bacterium]